MQLEGVDFEVMRACELAQVSRAGFYRHFGEHQPKQADIELLDAIQRIAIESRCYGYRRVHAALRADGWIVNHKRVLRLMREDDLLSLPKRPFVLTTDSRHPYGVFPNLVADLCLTAINQVWVADITYIRLREAFLYLAAILDAFSRRVLGWELADKLEAELVVAALSRALADRTVMPGTIHHSDQGAQYASKAYVEKLLDCGFRISMSRKAAPWENARAESFMKTLKTEEVYLRAYRDKHDARSSIAHFIEQVYNRKRLHSALNYLTPIEFEAWTACSASPSNGVAK